MAWYHRLFNVARPERLSHDLDRELDFHLAERTEELMAEGMSRAEAATEARRRFGTRAVQKERARDADALIGLESVVADVRYAARALRKSPGFTAVAVLSLGLGIGANSAIFSLMNALTLKSLPVSHPEELVVLDMGANGNNAFTTPLWDEIRTRSSAFAGTLAYSTTSFELTRGGVIRRGDGAWVSGGFFAMLGVRAIAGRPLQRADDARGCAPLAAVSAAFAASEFGGADAAVGKTISLNGHAFGVVGVIAPAFTGMEVGRRIDIYAPICAQVVTTGRPDALDQRSRWYLTIMARPLAGVSPAQFTQGFAGVAPATFAATAPPHWSPKDQAEYRQTELRFRPAAAGVSGLRATYSRALTILMVLVGVVLVIACANIANLLLARAAAREREMAVRLAIGAGRWRLVRQLLTESLLLSLLGAAIGMLFARWAGQALVGFLGGENRSVWLDLTVDGRVLGFTIAIAMATGIVFGLLPAWRATRVDPQSAMRGGGRTIVGRGLRAGKMLVVGQVALSLALMSGAGLLLASFQKLLSVDPGFRYQGVGLSRINLGRAGFKGPQLVVAQSEMLRRIREIPGVSAASVTVYPPIGRGSWNDYVQIPGYTPARAKDSLVYFNQVGDGYFATLETGVLAGRVIGDVDVAGARNVAVINQAMALKMFGGLNAVGQSFRVPRGDSAGPPYEVVGVVRDAKYRTLDEEMLPTAYFPLGVGDTPATNVAFVFRANDLVAARAAITEYAAQVSPSIPLEFSTLSQQVATSLARPRLLAALSSFFGGLALLLAVLGLYGTISYNVAQRRSEIGVRVALGATNHIVVKLVAGEAGRLVAVGVLVGLVLSLAGARLVASFLFGVTPTDVPIFGIAALTLAVVAMTAALIPAWRAARVDPMAVLRRE